MKCPKCGAQLFENASFCHLCGTKIEVIDESIKEESISFSTTPSSNDDVFESFQEIEHQYKKTEYEIPTIEEEPIDTNELKKDVFRFEKEEKPADTKNNTPFSKKITLSNINMDGLRDAIVDNWDNLDWFGKLLVALFGLTVLLLFISSVMNRTGIKILSIVQLFAIGAIYLIHIDEIKVTNNKLKYILTGLVCIFMLMEFSNLTVSPATNNHSQKSEIPTIAENQETDEKEGIHCYPIKDYVGLNLASIGSYSSGFRKDSYGVSDLKLIYIASDGTYIIPNNTEQLKQYKVVDQSIPAGVNVIYVNTRYSDGSPAIYTVSYQNYEEIILYVTKIEETNDFTPEIVKILPTIDRHEFHVRNYVGRNAASFGKNYSDKRYDSYGNSEVNFIFSTTDGTYVNPTDINDLKQYQVISQSVEPNTVINLIYFKDSSGEEAEYSIQSQDIEEITLTVQKLDESVIEAMKQYETDDSQTEDSEVVDSNEDTSNKPSGKINLEYKVNWLGEAEIVGYSGEGTSVKISNKIDGHKVTKIAKDAFKDCSTLETITNYADLTEIGDGAFQNCTSLTKISLPIETTKIGEHAFEGCTSLSSVTTWGDPGIGAYAFSGCTALTSISIGVDTPYIGDHAFDGCTSLSSVYLYSDCNIGNYAFHNCTALTSISIGVHIKIVGEHAFDGCSSLSKATIWSEDTIIGKGAFDNCPLLEDRPKQVD